MKFPKAFEFEEWWPGDKTPIRKYVTVLDQFEHHYTRITMYHVRIEYIGFVVGYPMVEYATWTEQQMASRLAGATSKVKE